MIEPATEAVLEQLPRAAADEVDAAAARAKGAGFERSESARALGPHALDAYTEVKSIYYATTS